MSKNRISSIEAQFELERILRERILGSLKNERNAIAEQAYTELFEKFPDHSVFLITSEAAERKGKLGAGLILPLSQRGSKVLEVGCGRGEVLRALAERGRICTGIEVSRDMMQLCDKIDVKVVYGVADSLDFPAGSFDVVFSQEVLEHLHPEDVPGHFAEAFRVLRPNGILAVETPNRQTGPQDISRGFTRVAEGLHLKEWTVRELIQMFQKAGFVKIRGLLAPQFVARRSETMHHLTQTPAIVKYFQSLLLVFVPTLRLRKIVGKLLGLDDIYLFAKKPDSGQ
ncbi:MAG: class I SAM-dependent methyltransferase [Planctomycetota bacterium]|jgi:SAM-dependent methyltransferase